MLIYAIMLIFSLFLVNFERVRDALGSFFSTVGGAIGALFFWLLNNTGGYKLEPKSSAPADADDGLYQWIADNLPDAGDDPVTWFIIYAVVALVALAVLYFIYRFVRLFIRAVLPAVRRERVPPEEAGYTDENEDLFDWKRFGASLRGRFRRKPRRPAFDDQPDTRAKVRFTYKRLISPREGGAAADRSLTPLELAVRYPDKGLESFIGVYNSVRYSESDPPENAEQTARAAYRVSLKPPHPADQVKRFPHK